jgi:hypothetical protein
LRDDGVAPAAVRNEVDVDRKFSRFTEGLELLWGVLAWQIPNDGLRVNDEEVMADSSSATNVRKTLIV